VLVSIQGLVLNDKPYFNEPAIFSSKEKHSLAYNTTAFLLSCKTMLYSLQNPPKVITEPSFLAKVLLVLCWLA
jgi:ubiquitin-conjugating enzyme E2 O